MANVPGDFAITKATPGEFVVGGRLCVYVNNVDGAALVVAKDQLKAAFDNRDAAVSARAAADQTNSSDAVAKTAQLKTLDAVVSSAEAKLVTAQADLAKVQGKRQFALFLDGQRTPARISVNPSNTAAVLDFRLPSVGDASTDDAKLWRNFMGSPDGATGTKKVEIGIGPADTQSPVVVLQPDKAPRLFVYRPIVAWVALVGVGLLILMLAMVAYRTDMLREPQYGEPTGPNNEKIWRRYSLAKTQMAFWGIITACGFVLIWVVTGQFANVMNSGTFALLGISGATAVGATAVGSQQAKSEKEAADSQVKIYDPPSKNFLYDLVSDGKSPQVHRWQVVIWTLILGAVYIYNIGHDFTLTDFDPNLLALTGIIGGTYVALKTQETTRAPA